MGEEIMKQAGQANVINRIGELSLLQTAALMKNAAMNYVNDSAPLHIASSVNAPVTAFFLSTITRFGFGPLSDVSKIIEAFPVPPCRPCGLHGKKSCPEKHFNCAMQIKITDNLLP
jgi:heptosyltransferase-2